MTQLASSSRTGSETSILLLDNDTLFGRSVEAALRRNNHEILTADDLNSALKILRSEKVDLIIATLEINGDPAVELVKGLKAHDPETDVIVVTPRESVRVAVDAVKQGAYSYVAEPFDDEELLLQIEKALEYMKLKREFTALKEEIAWRYSFDSFPGVSEAAAQIQTMASKVAGTDFPVLITGEPGTGKETLARAIHHHSNRRKGNFISVKCASATQDFPGGAVFSTIKDSSGSAHIIGKGWAERANGGTIFLDEVSDLPVNLQEKTMDVLKESETSDTASSASRKADVRIIASTSRDLRLLAEEGKFRQDLFRQLNILTIHIPPLRERAVDIPPLVEHFIRRANSREKERRVSITPEAMERLISHSWPNNVRELESTVNRAIGLASGNKIGAGEILFIGPEQPSLAPPGHSHVDAQDPVTLEESLKERIEKALYANDWNLTRTAVNLGIGRTTLWRKIKKHNIRRKIEADIEEIESLVDN